MKSDSESKLGYIVVPLAVAFTAIVVWLQSKPLPTGKF